MDNTLLYILLIVSNIALLIIAGFAVPCLLQLRRAAQNLTQTLAVINQSLPDIMQNVEQMTGHLNRQVEDVSLTIRKLQGTFGLLIGLEEILRHSMPLHVTKILSLSLAVAKGVRVFASHLMAERPVTKENPAAEQQEPRGSV